MTAVRPSVASSLRISMQIADGTVILSIVGTVDTTTTPMLSAHVANALLPRPRTVLLDMRRVTSCTPAGCEALVRAHRHALPIRVAIVADTRRCGHRAGECPVPLYASIRDALTAHTTG